MDRSQFEQLETALQIQLEKCEVYEKMCLENRDEVTATRLKEHHHSTLQDLDTLRAARYQGKELPKFNFTSEQVHCKPINVHLKEKELELSIRTLDLPVADRHRLCVVGEFEYPVTGRHETPLEITQRWGRRIHLEPKSLCCSTFWANPRQLDMAFSVSDNIFREPDSNWTDYDRPMLFYVDKGRSRTFKRKFKPVKLTFYEKRTVRCDKQLGTVQVKIEGINDNASLVVKAPILFGRRSTDAVAEIRIRVREPLVDKSARSHDVKLLHLTPTPIAQSTT